jgi:carbon-monoxide dehydrogenase small subunit
MTRQTIEMTVNRKAVAVQVEARTQLADLLREDLLLTGTHIGCEHGVCGACTVHIDGVPARSCITYAVSCQGASVRTIEDFDDDEVMTSLREAFSKEHALQCGYCTPGMLATARDIVRRLPEIDEERVRIELSGNLCRCTGYSGIVRAVLAVLDSRRGSAKGDLDRRVLGPAGSGHHGAAKFERPKDRAPMHRQAATSYSSASKIKPNIEIKQSFAIEEPIDQLWLALSDIENVVSCLPGASLTEPVENGRLTGSIRIAMGPIKATFRGVAQIELFADMHTGVITGQGEEERGSSTAGELRYALTAETDRRTRVDVHIAAAIKGPLANFSRSNLVQELVKRITANFAENLAARLVGGFSSETSRQSSESIINIGSIIAATIWARLKNVLKFRR